MATVKAQRNGEVREFEEGFWNQMPSDKYGWKPAAEVPEVLQEKKEEPKAPEPPKEEIPAKSETLADKLKKDAKGNK